MGYIVNLKYFAVLIKYPTSFSSHTLTKTRAFFLVCAPCAQTPNYGWNFVNLKSVSFCLICHFKEEYPKMLKLPSSSPQQCKITTKYLAVLNLSLFSEGGQTKMLFRTLHLPSTILHKVQPINATN